MKKGRNCVLQGKGTGDFVQFRLEPEILGEAKLGYEEVHNREMFAPHFGIDESGKGDFFGPLVIAGVYVDRGITKKFMEAGIQDSKRIGSDKRIRDLAKIIKAHRGRLRASWKSADEVQRALPQDRQPQQAACMGHARVIENLATARPDCPRALSDQFANPRLIERSLMQRGKTIKLEQRTKAESDLAVAARRSCAGTIHRLDGQRRAGKYQKTIPRGAFGAVKQVAERTVRPAFSGCARARCKNPLQDRLRDSPPIYSAKAE